MKPWIELLSLDKLEEIINYSYESPVAIYKHSTSCGTSFLVKDRIERGWEENPKDLNIYFLDVIGDREISNEVENRLNVRHESPQLILISGGKVIYNASHMSISYQDLLNSFLVVLNRF